MVTMPVSCGRGHDFAEPDFIAFDEQLHTEDAQAAEVIVTFFAMSCVRCKASSDMACGCQLST